MASPCEILMDVEEQHHARNLLNIAATEAHRIERKFSRYRDDNIVHQINHSQGESVEVDNETASMLDYANQCHQLSDGLFDITSGVLRTVWRFDGSDDMPSKVRIKQLLSCIGWQKVLWERPIIQLPANMEIDLGGIGKEYAVDRTAQLLREHCDSSCLVNYGGDIAVTRPRLKNRTWVIGIEKPSANLGAHANSEAIELKQGAVATSGDARRFLLLNRKRYSHILDPRTGWPVEDAPRSVTVISGTCTEAGILATLAMLRGAKAESFLDQQGVKYWLVR